MKALPIVAFVLLLASSCLRAEDPAAAEAMIKKLLKAQTAKNYGDFVADGTDQLKAALTKTQFEASSDLMLARTKDGYDLTPLGSLNQHGYEVYLYRLRFKKGDDMLATLSLKDGKVGGIYFK